MGWAREAPRQPQLWAKSSSFALGLFVSWVWFSLHHHHVELWEDSGHTGVGAEALGVSQWPRSLWCWLDFGSGAVPSASSFSQPCLGLPCTWFGSSLSSWGRGRLAQGPRACLELRDAPAAAQAEPGLCARGSKGLLGLSRARRSSGALTACA